MIPIVVPLFVGTIILLPSVPFLKVDYNPLYDLSSASKFSYPGYLTNL